VLLTSNNRRLQDQVAAIRLRRLEAGNLLGLIRLIKHRISSRINVNGRLAHTAKRYRRTLSDIDQKIRTI